MSSPTMTNDQPAHEAEIPEPKPPRRPAEISPSRKRNTSIRFLAGIVAAVLGLALYFYFHPTRQFNPSLYPRSLYLEKAGFTLIPESDRPLDRLVMGLSVASNDYFGLTKVVNGPGLDPKKVLYLQKMMYWIDLEISYGQIWNILPKDTLIYVGYPAAREKDWFKEFLQIRWGWKSGDFRKRMRFYETPYPMIWSQDIGEVMGRDPLDRIVIMTGKGEPGWYSGTVASLVKAYPNDFTVRETGPTVSTEGGDLELVWGPGNQPAILAGRFAAVRYLQRLQGDFPVSQKASIGQILDAKQAYQSDFFGLPVVFLPQSALEDPSQGDPQLFHLDMLAAVIADNPKPRAFIPTYLENPIDATTGQPLDSAFRNRLQKEFNLTALEMSSLGYDVIRLPFADHPVRSPANLLKYYDPAQKREIVMLSKYPDNIPRNGAPSVQRGIYNALGDLNNWCASWIKYPTDQNFSGVINSYSNVWNVLRAASGSDNPVFDEQKSLIEKCGYQVIPVPMYPWGAGGLHCETLH